MAYTVEHSKYSNQAEEVNWNNGYMEERRPTLAEIIQVAIEEFPEVPLNRLIITAHGYEAETICLKQRESS